MGTDIASETRFDIILQRSCLKRKHCTRENSENGIRKKKKQIFLRISVLYTNASEMVNISAVFLFRER